MIESGLNHKISHEATKGYQNASIISQQLILRYYYYQKCFINVISRVILYRLRYSKHSHKIWSHYSWIEREQKEMHFSIFKIICKSYFVGKCKQWKLELRGYLLDKRWYKNSKFNFCEIILWLFNLNKAIIFVSFDQGEVWWENYYSSFISGMIGTLISSI